MTPLYAYCSSPLKDHLINTLNKLDILFSKDYVIVCKKITSILASKGLVESKDRDRVIELCRSFARLSALLHDIGKAIRCYQEGVEHNVPPDKCVAKYPYHEVFSSIIVYHVVKELDEYLVQKFNVNNELLRLIDIMPSMIVLLHHYAMERLKGERIRKWINKLVERGCFGLSIEALELICNLIPIVYPDTPSLILDNITERLKYYTMEMDYGVVISVLREIEYYNRKELELALQASMLATMISIADYYTGSEERGGDIQNTYISSILAELGYSP